MPKDRARPDPVSCQLCRAKKLKCSRSQPCSNCVARGVGCHFLVPPPRQPNPSSTVLDDREVLKRLEVLETRIQARAIEDGAHTTVNNVSRIRPMHSLGTRAVGTHTPDSRATGDDDLVFDIGTREDSLLFTLSGVLKFRLCTLHEIILTPDGFSSFSIAENGCSVTLVKLPSYSTALLLLQSFEGNHDHLCRLMHLPTVKAMMKSVYLRVNQTSHTQPGQVALLLSIFAIAAYFYHPLEHSGITATEDEADRLSKCLAKGALDVLDHSRRSSSGNMEDVQAYIIMSVLLQYLDGFSARARHMLASAALIARDLRLHRLDAGTEDRPVDLDVASLRILIDREVKRRVMWYIASSDWLSAALPGPQEGTYSIHPNHLSLRLPKICADDDVGFGGEQDPATRPQPTGQTFFLENIRLAHICREIVDTVPLETPKLMQLPYERILDLDKGLKEFDATLPFFFKTDAGSRERTKSLEPIYPSIPLWRYCITTATHIVRCRLHHRFMVRQSVDRRYVYSRQACLESARIVVRVYEDISTMYPPSSLMARMGKAAQLVHSALIILITDFCLNNEEKIEAELSAEISPVLNIFETAKGVSALASKALSALHGLLKKHKILLTDLPASTAGYITPTIDGPPGTIQPGMVDTHEDLLDFTLDELWYGASPYEFSADWDGGFPGLDQMPI